MIVERSMHESWLSNAFLLADEAGGTAVFVDSGAPLEPLLAAVERESLTPTHLLVTHGHGDHVAGNDELRRRFELVTRATSNGRATDRALPTPGHSGRLSFVVDDRLLRGDTLFATPSAAACRRDAALGDGSPLTLPPETRVLPGHTDETTIAASGSRTRSSALRGLDGGTAGVHVNATSGVVVWSPARRQGQGARAALRRIRAIVGASRIEGLDR